MKLTDVALAMVDGNKLPFSGHDMRMLIGAHDWKRTMISANAQLAYDDQDLERVNTLKHITLLNAEDEKIITLVITPNELISFVQARKRLLSVDNDVILE